MRIVVFGPERRVGVLQREQVIDAHSAYAKYVRETQDEPRPYEMAAALVPSDLGGFVESGRRALENSQKAVEYVSSKAHDQSGLKGERVVYSLSEVKLHPPLARGNAALMMCGGNFADWVKGVRLRRDGVELTIDEVISQARSRPMSGFWKVPRRYVGPDEEVYHPAKTQRLDYEGEVAIIFGKRGRDIPEGRIGEHIWGYTLLNDFTMRDQPIQPGPHSFAWDKNFDTGLSLGPCIVVGEITDPQNVPYETQVNGEVRQRGNTANMIRSYSEYIAWLSRDNTVLPGDMLSSGTCAGTAADTGDEYCLKPGDVIEITSPLIGSLRNRIVARPERP